MAVIGTAGKVTLLDIAKSMAPDGSIADVAELLSQTNEVLLDMPYFEANGTSGHEASVRIALPTSVWRQFYQGVPPSKGGRAKITDQMGMLEARSEVDSDLVRLNGNSAAFRASEAAAFVESMNQTMATALFYGNQAANPEQFNGFAPRYNIISGAPNAQNIIDAGGTGSDNASIWLVVWGKNTVHGIYPKGSQAGLDHQDLGEIDAFDSNQNRFRAMADLWKWKTGLHVKDWRYVVRIANLDVSNTIAETSAPDIVKLMLRAMARIPHRGMGQAVFYMPRTMGEMLSLQALSKSQNALGIVEAVRQFGGAEIGVPELRFFGIPVRFVDRLLTTEARIV